MGFPRDYYTGQEFINLVQEILSPEWPDENGKMPRDHIVAVCHSGQVTAWVINEKSGVAFVVERDKWWGYTHSITHGELTDEYDQRVGTYEPVSGELRYDKVDVDRLFDRLDEAPEARTRTSEGFADRALEVDGEPPLPTHQAKSDTQERYQRWYRRYEHWKTEEKAQGKNWSDKQICEKIAKEELGSDRLTLDVEKRANTIRSRISRMKNHPPAPNSDE